MFREVDYASGEANATMNLGNIYSNLGEKDKAIDHYNQALPYIHLFDNL